MEQHEVEEVSFLPGEAILNKKAVYEPSKSQRFRQIICSRGIAISILFGMGATMIGIALIAAFARPASINGFCTNSSSSISLSSSLSGSSPSSSASANAGKTNTPTNSENKPKPNFIATNGAEFPWKELRLPKSVKPINYDIFLHPNISQSYFKGNVRMTLKIVEKTDFIVFHTHQLNLSDIGVKYSKSSDDSSGASLENSCRVLQSHDGVLDVEDGDRKSKKTGPRYNPGASVGIKIQLEYEEYQQYYIQVKEELLPGTNIDVTVGFRGSMADMAKMTGLYKSAYTVNGDTRYMVSTHFEPSSARTAFPCLDEPDLKATFSLQIVRESTMISLFNTKLLRHESYHDEFASKSDLVLDVYKQTVCMSTYLVAYVVTDFKPLTKYTKDEVMVRVWAPEDKIYMGQFALDAAVTIIENYNKFFGIAYPLEKQDLIAIPNFAAGAMENWGLITYRDTAVLHDPEKSTAYSKKLVALVVAHELAHQWFGNLVTMKWWNDLWLNEGFASYVENIGAQTVDSSFHMFESMVTDGRRTLNLDGLSSSHPLEVMVEDPAEVESAFNSITYNKGACLIHMLKGAIGEEEFHQGLNFYLRVHAYGNAETKQLWEAFEKYSNLDNLRVSEFMDTWTKQMGYPVVMVTRNKDQIKLTQERFLLNNDSDTSSYSWHVPFKYKLSDDPSKTEMVWMKKGDASFHLPSSTSVLWIKGNADSEGFYRVNYDIDGWKAITQQLMKDHNVFSVLDRVGLLDDAFNFAKSGRLPYSVVLNLCQYLVKETDYFVWETFTSNIGFLMQRLYLHESYDDLKTFIIYLAKPLLDSIGWEDAGSITQRLLRSEMFSLAVSMDYDPVTNEAKDWFKRWLADPNIKLNNDLCSLIYQSGIQYGSKADWDVVYDRFEASLVPSNKQSLMMALTDSRDARVLQILLERSLNASQIKSQSTTYILTGVAANPTGLLYAWRFLRQHWNTYFDRYGSGSFTMASLISHLLRHFSTQFDLDEITSFFQDKDLGTGKNAYHQTLDVIKAKIAWEKVHLDPVSVWLAYFVKTQKLTDESF